MRFLFVTPPFPGHLFATAPVAQALCEAGHEVVYAGMEPARRYVPDAEFVPILAPGDPGIPGLGARLLAPVRDRLGSSAEQRTGARAELAAYRAFLTHGAGELARESRADLALVDHAWPFLALPLRAAGVPAAVLSSWLPQVHEPGQPPLSSDVVADGSLRAKAGAERDWARHLAGRQLWRRPRVRALGNDIDYFRLTRSLAAATGWPRRLIREQTQLPAPMVCLPQLYLAPSWLDFERRPDPLRHYVEPGTGTQRPFADDEPVDWASAGDRPVVYVSFGSQAGLYPEAIAFFERVVAIARRRGEWHFLLVTGGASSAGLEAAAAAAANVTVLRHASPLEILPRCAAVIHHAGLNFVREAMSHGVPQIVVPLSRDRDQHGNAARVMHHQLGLRIGAASAEAGIEGALDTVLSPGPVRTRCGQARADMAREVADRSWISLLEGWAGDHRAGPTPPAGGMDPVATGAIQGAS
jgi:zeaxanthin glucosyltransferase